LGNLPEPRGRPSIKAKTGMRSDAMPVRLAVECGLANL